MARFFFGSARNAVALTAALVLSVPGATSVLAQGDPGHVPIPSAPTFPVPATQAPLAPQAQGPAGALRPTAPVPMPQPTSK
jgi:hypothetical protein